MKQYFKPKKGELNAMAREILENDDKYFLKRKNYARRFKGYHSNKSKINDSNNQLIQILEKTFKGKVDIEAFKKISLNRCKIETIISDYCWLMLYRKGLKLEHLIYFNTKPGKKIDIQRNLKKKFDYLKTI